jgi:hypothetical protein
MRERDIENHLIDLAERYKWLLRKIRYIGRNGAPDRMLINPDGQITFVELKAPGKKPRPLQGREHLKLVQYGQRVVTIDSIKGVEDLFK